jgi:formimidoylglutamate deiminase
MAMVRELDASIVICPSTEANLGDGVFDLRGWIEIGGRWSIGSDSQATRSPIEELRLLEYSQRLALRERNVAARAAGAESTAGVLLNGAVDGGSVAAGQACGGLALGQRADFCVPDPLSTTLAGVPAPRMLDALVFSSPDAAMVRVCVAGGDVDLHPPAREFTAVMRALW